MKVRTAKKIYIAVGAYKAFETDRQPYTPEQQRKAIKAMHIPLHLRHMMRICRKVKDPKKFYQPFAYVRRGSAATGEIRKGYTGSKLITSWEQTAK